MSCNELELKPKESRPSGFSVITFAPYFWHRRYSVLSSVYWQIDYSAWDPRPPHIDVFWVAGLGQQQDLLILICVLTQWSIVENLIRKVAIFYAKSNKKSLNKKTIKKVANNFLSILILFSTFKIENVWRFLPIFWWYFLWPI